MVKNIEYKSFSSREKQVIFVGRLDKTKGIDKLLMAWKEYNSRCKGEAIKLIICGTGPEKDWCENYISINKLKKVVEFKGYVENDKVVKLIAKSLGLILPTQWYEGFPMTIVEAYRHGTPVLGSEIGNVGEIVLNDVTGYTFNQTSIDSIIESINKLLEASNNGLSLFDSTFKYYQRHYNKEQNFNILKDIYNKITV